MDEWFRTFNQKIDKIGINVTAIRGELTDLREFIEQHQTDIRLCKLAIERIDEKVGILKRNHL